MKKEITTDKKNGIVTVSVEIPKRVVPSDPVIQFRTRDIALMLEKEGIKVMGCRKNDSIINDSENSKTSGVWIFSIPKSEQKKESLTKTDKGDNIQPKAKTTSNKKT